ncbi:hypothetical protein B0H14DRAFT_3486051 [Mycena olivaceomarginata]|nr:hypothetical protein B0H14DRAFT_3486051 [Mycena olivaceomarginata]
MMHEPCDKHSFLLTPELHKSKSSMFSSLRKVSKRNLRTSNTGTDKSNYPPLPPPPLNAGGFVSFLPIPSPPPTPCFKHQKKKLSQGDDVPPASICSFASSASSNSASALTSKSTTTIPILAALTACPALAVRHTPLLPLLHAHTTSRALGSTMAHGCRVAQALS